MARVLRKVEHPLCDSKGRERVSVVEIWVNDLRARGEKFGVRLPSGRAEDNKHLSRLHDPIDTLQDLDLTLLSSTKETLDGSPRLERHVSYRSLEIRRGSESVNGEVAESYSSFSHRRGVRTVVGELPDGSSPGSRVEIVFGGERVEDGIGDRVERVVVGEIHLRQGRPSTQLSGEDLQVLVDLNLGDVVIRWLSVERRALRDLFRVRLEIVRSVGEILRLSPVVRVCERRHLTVAAEVHVGADDRHGRKGGRGGACRRRCEG